MQTTTNTKMYVLYSRVLLNKCGGNGYNQEYLNVVTINKIPEGPLAPLVRRVNFPKVSSFQDNNTSCQSGCDLVISSLGNGCSGGNYNYLQTEELGDLIVFLSNNGYIVDTGLSNMSGIDGTAYVGGTKKIIAFIRWVG
jgi:hypothetical protein